VRSKTLTLIGVLSFSYLLAGPNDVAPVLAAQRRWIGSYNQRNEKVLAEIEAGDFRIAFGDGTIQTKADQLKNLLSPLPAGAEYEIVIETSEVRRYRNAAVVTGVVVEKGRMPDEQGAMRPFTQRSRYTDTWILQRGHWTVVSSHMTELK
jgi:hypothetical protein